MAKTIVAQTERFTRKMAININTAKSMQTMSGDKIENVSAAAVVTDVDRETGEEKTIAVIVDGYGRCYSSISQIVLDSMDDVMGLVDDGETFDILIEKRTAQRSGREYVTMSIV